MKKYKKFDFAILIPVFHNEDKIKNLKTEIFKYLSNYNFFVCFVDDSKNDLTSFEIKKNFLDGFHIVKRDKKEEYSTRYSASLDGFKWIVANLEADYIVEIDSDLSHHPKDIVKGLKKLKDSNCDLIIASKYKSNSIVKNRQFLRIIISKFITVVCRLLFNKKITDYSNTFRFYKFSLVKKFVDQNIIFKSPIGHLHNLLNILEKKYSIQEISTEYIESNRDSTVKIIFMIRYLVEFIYCIILNKFKKTK